MVDTPGRGAAWGDLGCWRVAVETASLCQGSGSGLVLSSGNGKRNVPRWWAVLRGALHALVRREKVPEAVWPPTQDKVTTHGLHRVRSSVEPSTVSAFTPDPYRGWGRYCLAHIRAQKAPVDRRRAPALNTIDLEGSPGGSLQIEAASDQETPLCGWKNYRSGECAERDSSKSSLLTPSTMPSDEARTPLQKESRAGCPAGLRDGLPCRRLRADMVVGFERFQVAFDLLPRLRVPPRLLFPVSTGSVPLQSG